MQIIDGRLLRQRYATGLPDYGPLMVHEGRLRLRMDPYGLPWTIQGNQVVSSGYQRHAYERLLGRYTSHLLKKAQDLGYWPQTLEEVNEFDLLPPKPPQKGILKLDDRRFWVEWLQEPAAPWRLRNEK